MSVIPEAMTLARRQKVTKCQFSIIVIHVYKNVGTEKKSVSEIS